MKINALNQDARRCQTQTVTKAKALTKRKAKANVCDRLETTLFIIDA